MTRVYRPYEILKGIRHCRLPGLSRDRRTAPHPPFILARAAAIDRILQKFIASLTRTERLQSLSVPLSLIGDPLSSRINRALSRRKADTRGRDVASFYLFVRRVYRIFLPLPLSSFLSLFLSISFFLFPIFRVFLSETPR